MSLFKLGRDREPDEVAQIGLPDTEPEYTEAEMLELARQDFVRWLEAEDQEERDEIQSLSLIPQEWIDAHLAPKPETGKEKF